MSKILKLSLAFITAVSVINVVGCGDNSADSELPKKTLGCSLRVITTKPVPGEVDVAWDEACLRKNGATEKEIYTINRPSPSNKILRKEYDEKHPEFATQEIK
ncbi:MAG: hypothetical protein ACT4OY_03660 [Alphaproteobacteria bacterium]